MPGRLRSADAARQGPMGARERAWAMPKLLARFLRCEHGAVTADWVMMTALVVGIATGMGLALGFGPQSVVAQINEFVDTTLEEARNQ